MAEVPIEHRLLDRITVLEDLLSRSVSSGVSDPKLAKEILSTLNDPKIRDHSSPDTTNAYTRLRALVNGFSIALSERLSDSENRRQWNDAWMRDDWRGGLIDRLREELVQGGDPLDLAAYCAFAWFHGWTVSSSEQLSEIPV